jgi:prolyl-tRNA synthetase
MSWRSMSTLIMTHGDDQGLVLPPTLADPQVVVPIWQEENKEAVLDYAADVKESFAEAGVRVDLDDREGLSGTVEEHLDTIYAKLYASAEETLEEGVREAESREEILGTIGQHGGYVRCGWCGDEACEEPIKDAIAAEIVMVPLDREEKPVHGACAICGDDAEETAYFARTY